MNLLFNFILRTYPTHNKDASAAEERFTRDSSVPRKKLPVDIVVESVTLKMPASKNNVTINRIKVSNPGKTHPTTTKQ